VLIVKPRVSNKFLIRGRIWVDAEDLAIIRIEATPARSPSFWIRGTTVVHRYEKFGDFWLPVANTSRTNARLFGPTTVTINYSEYRINQQPAAARTRTLDAPVQADSR
jgi:hypothetical protein